MSNSIGVTHRKVFFFRTNIHIKYIFFFVALNVMIEKYEALEHFMCIANYKSNLRNKSRGVNKKKRKNVIKNHLMLNPGGKNPLDMNEFKFIGMDFSWTRFIGFLFSNPDSVRSNSIDYGKSENVKHPWEGGGTTPVQVYITNSVFDRLSNRPKLF